LIEIKTRPPSKLFFLSAHYWAEEFRGRMSLFDSDSFGSQEKFKFVK